jgi:hypothetical protein
LEETLISCQMHEAKHRRAAQISGRVGVLPGPALATFSCPIIFAIGVSVGAVRARPVISDRWVALRNRRRPLPVEKALKL